MNPLVSIIVPCYNQAQFLPEALQSVWEQTYENWECIIVNDGSPDNTHDVAQEWLAKDKRFKYIYKENGGLSSARNAGLDKAVGDYIQFLDCDDILECNKIEKQSLFFDKGIDVLISGYRYFENKEGVSEQRIIGRDNFIPETFIQFDDRVDIKDLFDLKNPFVICAPLYKSCVFEKVGNFDEQLHSLEDWDFNLRCALHNLTFQHTGYDKDSKALVRLHDSSMMRDIDIMSATSNKFRMKRYEDQLYISYFGIRNIAVTKKTTSKSIISIIKLFTPPIFLLLKNKLLKK